MSSEKSWCSAVFAIGLVALVALGVFAAAPDAVAEDWAQGQRIWTEKAVCTECHGWSGDGIGGADQNAPSLRQTRLTRTEIREAIQCGRRGTEMPYFDRFAYRDRHCYGATAEELGDEMPNRAPTSLQSYEIDALADYIATKVKGAGPTTRAQCLAFFGGGGSRCDNYPDR